MPFCKMILKDGSQCRMYALKGREFCFSHDPENRETKLEAVRKGGAAKGVKLLQALARIEVVAPPDIVRLLAVTINEVRDGKTPPQIANTIGFLAGHLLKAFEVIGQTGRGGPRDVRIILTDIKEPCVKEEA